MKLPLSLEDVSLWLALTAIILLSTSELISPYHRTTNLRINRKQFRAAAILPTILFLLTLLIRAYEITLP